MKVAVTGGAGVVGRAVVAHLVEAGHDVAALSRNDTSDRVLTGLGADPIRGDLFDDESLRSLVAHREWVFNIAGVNELCSKDPSLMWATNVDGALAVLDACEVGGVPRLVQTSSAVTMGEPSGSVATEMAKHRGHFLSEYERSKTVAERLLLDRRGPVDVVCVNPSSVQGPGRSTGTGRLLLAAARGRARVAVDAVFSLVDIDDCARGHVLAAEKGRAGERYILSGVTATVREVLRRVGRLTKQPGRTYFLQPRVLEKGARLLAIGGMASGGLICEEGVRVLLSGHRYDGSKAAEDLGVTYRSLDDTLGRTIDWFGEAGLL